MIRDPSDGSVKPIVTPERVKEIISDPAVKEILHRRPTSAENWGLKSLDREARAPKPAMTAEELSEYYSKYTLGGKLKERKDADGR